MMNFGDWNWIGMTTFSWMSYTLLVLNVTCNYEAVIGQSEVM